MFSLCVWSVYVWHSISYCIFWEKLKRCQNACSLHSPRGLGHAWSGVLKNKDRPVRQTGAVGLDCVSVSCPCGSTLPLTCLHAVQMVMVSLLSLALMRFPVCCISRFIYLQYAGDISAATGDAFALFCDCSCRILVCHHLLTSPFF